MFKIGDTVKTLKNTRHGMIAKGTVGVVVEVRSSVGYSDGITVEFLRKPSPIIAAMFGKNPDVAEPFRCLFPLASANSQIAKC